MNQMDLTDIYIIFHHKAKENTYFSAPHSTFFTVDHIIRHKTHLNRYKNIELISCILSDYHRLVFNNNNNNRKPTCQFTNSLLKDNFAREEIKKEIIC